MEASRKRHEILSSRSIVAVVRRRRRLAWRAPVVATCLLVALSGANCQQMVNQYTQPLPRVLPPGASLAQVIEVVNSNSSAVISFSTMRATVSTPGYPALTANLAFQRPRGFRLRADSVFGPEVDLGSNETLFWFWVKQSNPPAMYFCRHDQFAASAARQILPVEPDWLAQALGIVSFDASEQHDGPILRRDGKLEINSTSPGPYGARRTTILDETSGIVLEQHVYDARGTAVAHAVLTGHQRDPASGVIMPRKVRISWPTSNFEMTIEMADLQINRLTADPAALFAKPEYQGYMNIDLASPGALGPAPAPPSGQISRFPPTR
jgi:hypothetical protein